MVGMFYDVDYDQWFEEYLYRIVVWFRECGENVFVYVVSVYYI